MAEYLNKNLRGAALPSASLAFIIKQRYCRMRILLAVIVMSFAILTSCRGPGKTPGYDRLAGEQVRRRNLTGKRMSVKDFWGRSIIGQYADKVLLTSQRQDSLFIIYTVLGDSLQNPMFFGLRGRGIYEFNSPHYNFRSRRLSIVNIQNLGPDKIIAIEIGKMSKMVADRYDSWQVYDLTWLGNINMGGGLVQVGEGCYILTAGRFNDANLLTYIDVSNMLEKPLGYWINDGEDLPNIPKQSVYNDNARLFYNETKGRLLYLSGEGWYLDLMDYSQGTISPHRVLYNRKPQYGSKDGLNYDIYIGCVRGMYVATTENYIYAMPRVAESIDMRYKGYYLNHFDEIDKFDWDGTYIETLCLDVPCFSFTISEEDDGLFAVTEDPDNGETYVTRFTLNEHSE